MMRGYRALKQDGRLGRVIEVADALTNTPFRRIPSRSSRLLFGRHVDNPELAVRQYVLTRVMGYKFSRAVLTSLGRPGAGIVHPLPREWRREAERQGLKIAKVRSAVL